jgi:hypothetical protein
MEKVIKQEMSQIDVDRNTLQTGMTKQVVVEVRNPLNRAGKHNQT